MWRKRFIFTEDENAEDEDIGRYYVPVKNVKTLNVSANLTREPCSTINSETRGYILEDIPRRATAVNQTYGGPSIGLSTNRDLESMRQRCGLLEHENAQARPVLPGEPGPSITRGGGGLVSEHAPRPAAGQREIYGGPSNGLSTNRDLESMRQRCGLLEHENAQARPVLPGEPGPSIARGGGGLVSEHAPRPAAGQREIYGGPSNGLSTNRDLESMRQRCGLLEHENTQARPVLPGEPGPSIARGGGGLVSEHAPRPAAGQREIYGGPSNGLSTNRDLESMRQRCGLLEHENTQARPVLPGEPGPSITRGGGGLVSEHAPRPAAGQREIYGGPSNGLSTNRDLESMRQRCGLLEHENTQARPVLPGEPGPSITRGGGGLISEHAPRPAAGQREIYGGPSNGLSTNRDLKSMRQRCGLLEHENAQARPVLPGEPGPSITRGGGGLVSEHAPRPAAGQREIYGGPSIGLSTNRDLNSMRQRCGLLEHENTQARPVLPGEPGPSITRGGGGLISEHAPRPAAGQREIYGGPSNGLSTNRDLKSMRQRCGLLEHENAQARPVLPGEPGPSITRGGGGLVSEHAPRPAAGQREIYGGPSIGLSTNRDLNSMRQRCGLLEHENAQIFSGGAVRLKTKTVPRHLNQPQGVPVASPKTEDNSFVGRLWDWIAGRSVDVKTAGGHSVEKSKGAEEKTPNAKKNASCNDSNESHVAGTAAVQEASLFANWSIVQNADGLLMMDRRILGSSTVAFMATLDFDGATPFSLMRNLLLRIFSEEFLASLVNAHRPQRARIDYVILAHYKSMHRAILTAYAIKLRDRRMTSSKDPNTILTEALKSFRH